MSWLFAKCFERGLLRAVPRLREFFAKSGGVRPSRRKTFDIIPGASFMVGSHFRTDVERAILVFRRFLPHAEEVVGEVEIAFHAFGQLAVVRHCDLTVMAVEGATMALL